MTNDLHYLVSEQDHGQDQAVETRVYQVEPQKHILRKQAAGVVVSKTFLRGIVRA